MRLLVGGWCLVLVFAVMSSELAADELRPAYIEFTQHDTTNWGLRWKASAKSRLGRSGKVKLPANCQSHTEEIPQVDGGNILRSAEVSCAGEVTGQIIGLNGLETTNTDALVRIQMAGQETLTLRLTPQQPTITIPQPTQGVVGNVMLAYTVIGIEHIVWGFDHFFFVLALVLLLSGWRRIAWTVTAFTLAHSITLVGTTLGWLSLPQRPVEAVIALSIVFLAVEIIKMKPGELRLSEQFPWVVAFLFGLLHGFGFAGALAEIGLPQNAVPLALFGFNLGVELGQLAIVAGALLVLAVARRYNSVLLGWLRVATAYVIGSVSMFWLLERTIA